jgi:hypothetical protein
MDLNTRAFAVVSKATNETPESDGGRREAARKAGRLGGAARAKVLTPQRRREIAVKANQARWNGTRTATNS